MSTMCVDKKLKGTAVLPSSCCLFRHPCLLKRPNMIRRAQSFAGSITTMSGLGFRHTQGLRKVSSRRNYLDFAPCISI